MGIACSSSKDYNTTSATPSTNVPTTGLAKVLKLQSAAEARLLTRTQKRTQRTRPRRPIWHTTARKNGHLIRTGHFSAHMQQTTPIQSMSIHSTTTGTYVTHVAWMYLQLEDTSAWPAPIWSGTISQPSHDKMHRFERWQDIRSARRAWERSIYTHTTITRIQMTSRGSK